MIYCKDEAGYVLCDSQRSRLNLCDFNKRRHRACQGIVLATVRSLQAAECLTPAVVEMCVLLSVLQ